MTKEIYTISEMPTIEQIEKMEKTIGRVLKITKQQAWKRSQILKNPEIFRLREVKGMYEQLNIFDYLSESRNKLYNDDCLKVLSGMGNESVDLVVTDCPYHIVSGGCTNDAVKIGDHYREGKLFEHNEIDFKDWLPEIYRVLKPNSHCYIMISPRNLAELQTECENVGFVFQNILIWDKGNVTPNRYYMGAYEMILFLRKGKAKNINEMGTKNLLRIPNAVGNKLHPTEKPSELMQIMIENSSEGGDVVLDPFMGAGSTGVACKRTNRNFIGIEIDEKYYKIAEQRIRGI